MNENLYEAQYVVTKKNKIKKFYDENKILAFSFILVLLISIGLIFFYLENKETKKIQLSEIYIEAKIDLKNGNKNKAKNTLKKVIFSNDSTYSVLSLFLILNENLISEKEEISNLFDHVLANNKFEKEIGNLIIFKKALYKSNYIDEEELMLDLKPLIETESLWKPHALLLLGDYFFVKNQNIKAKEFYSQILSIKNLHEDLYEKARLQLTFIINE